MNDQIGTRTEQGAEFPRLTIHGNPYDKITATVLNFDSRYFAVVGAGEAIDVVKLKALKEALPKQADTPAPSEPEKPAQETAVSKKERGIKDAGNS